MVSAPPPAMTTSSPSVPESSSSSGVPTIVAGNPPHVGVATWASAGSLPQHKNATGAAHRRAGGVRDRDKRYPQAQGLPGRDQTGTAPRESRRAPAAREPLSASVR